MPKEEIDYSNTIIYKIYCKDPIVNDIYVGHTTNFTKRKYSHKIECNNLKNHIKIYDTIRQNGGWVNWDMVEIAKYNCKDHTEARIKEQNHYEELKAKLNSCPPFVDKNSYFCKACNLQCNSPKQYSNHINCNLHIKKNDNNDNIKTPKNAETFYCECCDFKCFKYSDWERHVVRPKHIKNENDNKNGKNDNEKSQKNALFNCVCSCGKVYKHASGLSRHKNAGHCTPIQNLDNTYISTGEEESEFKVLTNLVLEVVKQNQELISQNNEAHKHNQELTNKIVEISKNGIGNTTITNSNNNSNNKTFNLNVFLNETCKDAMNIMDFVDSLKLQLSDLENVGRLGYVEGISNIIIKNLNEMDVHKRPVHCSDSKREVMYIKDEDKWEKENENKQKLRKAIKRVANKNQRLLPKFKEEHPDCGKYHSKFSDQYNKLVVESLGGSGDNDLEKEDKIIKKIAKEVTIDKNC
jgi:hypothetical protein